MNAARKSECLGPGGYPNDHPERVRELAGLSESTGLVLRFLSLFPLSRLRGECHSKTASPGRIGHVHS
jgi:hypothetical protein